MGAFCPSGAVNFWVVLLSELLETGDASQLKQCLDTMMGKQFHELVLADSGYFCHLRTAVDTGRV